LTVGNGSFLYCLSNTVERLLVVLRDGRKLYGVLRSFDQFGTFIIEYLVYFLFAANLVLSDTIERYYVELEFTEEHHGTFLVRGENVVLVGELVNTPFT